MNDGSTNVISAIAINIFLKVGFSLEFLIKNENGADAIKPRTRPKSKNLKTNKKKLGLANPSSIPKLTNPPIIVTIIAQMTENIEGTVGLFPFRNLKKKSGMAITNPRNRPNRMRLIISPTLP